MKMIYLLIPILVLYCNCKHKVSKLTHISPLGRYKIELAEQLEPVKPGEIAFVVLSVSKGSTLLTVEQRFAYQEDSGVEFFSKYPRGEWVAENILRLIPLTEVPIEFTDIVTVTNKTPSRLEHITINGNAEMFLILELEPNSSVKLLLRPQTDKDRDTSWIGVAGKFLDGPKLEPGGMNFDIHNKYIRQSHYCVSIVQNSVNVTSKEYEGIKHENGIEIRQPRSLSCE